MHGWLILDKQAGITSAKAVAVEGAADAVQARIGGVGHAVADRQITSLHRTPNRSHHG